MPNLPAIPTKVDISLKEAIEQIKHLEEESYEIFQSIREKKKQLIRVRFRQGAIVHHIAEQSDYGDGGVQELSERTGISDGILYDAKRFFELPQFGKSMTRLNQWLTEKEEKKGKVTWSYCRNVIRKRLDTKDDPEKEVDRQKKNLERRARRLEEDAEDLEEQVQEMDEKDQQAVGVAEQARRVAEDLRDQADRLEVPKQRRITDEGYLDFVREQPCVVTGQTPAEPHHLIPVGRGGPDYTAIPLTRQMHDEAQGRTEAFEREYGVNLWRECNLFLIKYIATYEE